MLQVNLHYYNPAYNGYNNVTAYNLTKPSHVALCYGSPLTSRVPVTYSQLFKSSMYYISQIAGNEAFLK